MEYQVTRCVCFKTTFEQWLKLKREHGWTLEEASRQTFCGEGCGMCKPYLAVVATTGCTELPVMSYEQMRTLAASPK